MNNHWLMPEITMAINYTSATMLSTLLTDFVPTVTIRGVCITFIPTHGWINWDVESLNSSPTGKWQG